MRTAELAVVLGLVAAFLFALAAFLQQRAARDENSHQGSLLASTASLMSRLVRSRTWLVGWGVNLGGFVAQAAALQVGSVAAVQPLMSTQLMFALPMSSLERRTWPRARDWISAGAICLGLVTLLAVDGASPLDGRADRRRVVLAALSALLLVAVLASVAFRAVSAAASVVMAAGAGLCFAMSAVFMKLTTDDLIHHGIAHTAADWVGYALAASTLLGLVLEQHAFASGPLPWSVAVMNAVNPVASYVIGMLAFRVALPHDLGSWAGIVVAGVLVVAGAVGLAHSPSTAVWLGEQLPEPQTG